MNSPLKYWYWFGALTGIDPACLNKLLETYGNAYEVYRQPQEEFLKQDYLNPRSIGRLMDQSLRQGLDERLNELAGQGIDIITIEDARYPGLVAKIADPPPVLFMRGGAPSKPGDRYIAVVGARRPTSYGIATTKRLVEGLAAYGFSIVSGLAAGIDAAAHRAALDAGVKTIAFLGCGVDRVYPAGNRALMGDIIMNGSVYSEYLPGAIPLQQNFPRRNRLISGASLATVVVEAGERSGSLITAGFAGEQGRDVFAVPGNITSPLSKGSNALIRDGAYIATSAEDIVFALNKFMDPTCDNYANISERRRKEAELALESLNGAELALAQLLKNRGPQNIDDIADQCAIPVSEAGAVAILLEIKGILRRMPDGAYEFAD